MGFGCKISPQVIGIAYLENLKNAIQNDKKCVLANDHDRTTELNILLSSIKVLSTLVV